MSREQDTKHFTNRLRLCSRDRCIHLLFAIDIERDRAYTDIERVIKMICSKEDERREIILKTDPSRYLAAFIQENC